MKIINYSKVRVDKEALFLTARQHSDLALIVRIYDWDQRRHGNSGAEFTPKGAIVRGRTIVNPLGEIHIYVEPNTKSDLVLWYFAHEYRHAMQEAMPHLRAVIYNSDRERLIAELSGGGEFTKDLYWRWHELLPEEIDANCFASVVAGKTRLDVGVRSVEDPTHPMR